MFNSTHRKICSQPSTVECVYNPSTWEVEAEDQEFSHPQLDGFEASLGYVRHSHTNTTILHEVNGTSV